MFILAEAVLPFRMLKSNRNVGNMHMLKITLYISTVFIMSILINSLLFQQVSAQSYNIKTIYLGAYDYGVTPLGLSKVTNTIYFGEGNPNIEGANSITGSTFKLSASGMLGDVLSISPNGGTLYAITGNSIIPINTLQNTIGNFIPVNSVGGMDDVIVSPNGSMIYASTKLGDFSYEYIYPYNLATSTAGNVITITTYGSALGPLAISPNGNTLYVGENPGKIYVVNLVTGTISNTINVPFNNKVSFTLSPNGNFLYAYGTPSLLGNIIPINTISYALGTPISTEIGTNTLSGIFSPDGKTFYAGEANGNIVPIDTSTYALDTPISTATNSILSLNMSPNGQILYAGGQSQVFVITFYPSISPSSSEAFDYGQSITFSSAWAGGTAPYTANWLIDNSITGVQLANALYTGISTTSNSFTWAFPSADVGNTVQGNVIITDSSTPQGISNSLKSAVITLNPSLGTPTLTSSPSLPSSQGNGNTITFTATATGGTSPYTYNYLITNTVTGNLVANMLFTNVASTTNSFAWTIPGADIGNTVQANVIVTDSAYSPETTNSVESGTLTITYTPLSTPTLSSCPSSPILDAGQTVSCTITVSGGVAPYTYNWLISNSITDAITANMLFTGVSSTSNTFTYTTVSSDTANSPEQFNVIVTDSHPTTVNSVYSSTFTINSALTTPSISPSNPTIDSGQSITFSSSWSGGTPDYTVKWYTGPSGNTCSQDSSNVLATYSGLSSTSNSITVSPTSTNSYCIGVTDSATTPETQLSSNDVVFVNSALGTPSLSASNTPTVDTGQYEAFSSSWTGGTLPYTANYLVFNTVTDALVANALYTGITGTSDTFLWFVPTADAGNTISANVFITDSASNPVTVNSIQLSIITISLSTTTSTTSTSTSTSTTSSTTLTTTTAPSGSGGGSGSGGVIINPPSTSISSTSTSSTTSTSTATSSTSTTSSILTTSKSSTTTSITSTSSIKPSTTIAPIVVSKSVSVSGTSAGKVNFTMYNITVEVSTSNEIPKNVTISFYRPTNITTSPYNYENIYSFYLNSSSAEVKMNVTIGYNCRYGTGVVPFAFENDTWNQIYNYIILQNPCRITFPATNDREVGLFVYSPSMQSTAVSTSIATTIAQKSPSYNTSYYYLAISVIILLIVIVYLIIKNRNKRK